MTRPSRAQLRKFGLLVGGILLVIGVWPLVVRGTHVRWWLVAPAVALAGMAAVAPAKLDPVYRAWMRVGELLGRINTAIILGLTFFLVVTPIGLIRRLSGSDPLDRSLGDRSTYWIARERKGDSRRLMERRF